MLETVTALPRAVAHAFDFDAVHIFADWLDALDIAIPVADPFRDVARSVALMPILQDRLLSRVSYVLSIGSDDAHDLSVVSGLRCRFINSNSLVNADTSQLELGFKGGRIMRIPPRACGSAEALALWQKLRGIPDAQAPGGVNAATRLLRLVVTPAAQPVEPIIRWRFT
jgi:hypothetical protein